MITANCGVGAYGSALHLHSAVLYRHGEFTGDQAQTDGEMPIRKALAPVEFAEDLKEAARKNGPGSDSLNRMKDPRVRLAR